MSQEFPRNRHRRTVLLDKLQRTKQELDLLHSMQRSALKKTTADAQAFARNTFSN